METYSHTPSLPVPKPSWLQEFKERLDDPVERFMLIGDPTIYTHLVPIKDLEPEPFVSVDPLTNPEFLEGGVKERVLVTGCFDLFHAGHAHFLSQVYKHYVGEYRELHVGLADDTSFAYLKKRKPIYPLEQRLAILESIKCVAKVHTFPVWVDVPGGLPGVEDGHRYLLDTVKPVLFVDSRQKPKERIGALPYLKEKSIPIKYVDSIGIHTCDILKGIKE